MPVHGVQTWYTCKIWMSVGSPSQIPATDQFLNVSNLNAGSYSGFFLIIKPQRYTLATCVYQCFLPTIIYPFLIMPNHSCISHLMSSYGSTQNRICMFGGVLGYVALCRGCNLSGVGFAFSCMQ